MWVRGKGQGEREKSEEKRPDEFIRLFVNEIIYGPFRADAGLDVRLDWGRRLVNLVMDDAIGMDKSDKNKFVEDLLLSGIYNV